MSVCLYSCLSCQTCKSHLFYAASYCHVWPFWLCHTFPYYLMNGTLFKKKKLLNKKYTLWFCLQILSQKFLIQDELLSQMYISLHIKYPIFLQYFNELWIFQSDLPKILKYKINIFPFLTHTERQCMYACLAPEFPAFRRTDETRQYIRR